MSNFIKLTSFQNWKDASEENKATERVFEDVLINPDHVVKVITRREGTRMGPNGLTFRPTILVLVGDRSHEVAENFEAVYDFLNGHGRRGKPRYVRGFLTDDWGNPIKGKVAAVG